MKNSELRPLHCTRRRSCHSYFASMLWTLFSGREPRSHTGGRDALRRHCCGWTWSSSSPCTQPTHNLTHSLTRTQTTCFLDEWWDWLNPVTLPQERRVKRRWNTVTISDDLLLCSYYIQPSLTYSLTHSLSCPLRERGRAKM
jgi:hypothetical protein